MSGPIVRSGATPEFSKNWEKIFGGAKKPSAAAKPAKKATAAKPKAAKKARPKGKKK